MDADAGKCILPVNLADLDFHGAPRELRAIGEFLIKAATELEAAGHKDDALNVGIDLRNSNPDPKVGLRVNVVRHVDE